MRFIITPPEPRHNSDRCQKQCPQAHPCCCRHDVRHTLHICNAPDCACHSRERYEVHGG